jgi:cold shock CspA family protein
MNDAPTTRHRGRIVSFRSSYGFIQGTSGRVFFHISDLTGAIQPVTGDTVSYSLGEDDRGRIKAEKVMLERN